MSFLLWLLTALWFPLSPGAAPEQRVAEVDTHVVNGRSKRCRITRFGGKADARAGGIKSPCLKRYIKPGDFGIAIRGARCGTRYELTNPRTGRRIVVPVIDYGPWLATLKSCGLSLRCRLKKHGSRVMTRLRRGYWYQENCVDGTPEALHRLGVKSLHYVDVRQVSR